MFTPVRFLFFLRKRETENAAVSDPLRFHPDLAAVCLDDSLDDCQTDAGSFDVLFQSLEKAENVRLIPRIYANPIVFDIDDVWSLLRYDLDFQSGIRLVSHELDRIVKKVFHHFTKPGSVTIEYRKILGNVDGYAPLGNSACQHVHGCSHQLVQRNILRGIHDATDPRKLQQFVE